MYWTSSVATTVIRSGEKMKWGRRTENKLQSYFDLIWKREWGRRRQEAVWYVGKLLLPLYRVPLRQVSSLNIDSNGSSISHTRTCSRAHHYKRPNWCKNSSLLRLHNSELIQYNQFSQTICRHMCVVCACIYVCPVSSPIHTHTLCRHF